MPKKRVIAVPKNLGEAAQFLSRIGKEQRVINKIKSDLNAKVEELKAKAISNAKPRQKNLSQLVEGLFAFAETHRQELTENGKRKTVKLPTGTFGWRMTPPAVSLRNAKSILKRLKSLGFKNFIRTKEEVDKEAILKSPDIAKTIKGISINQHEEFVAKPMELEVEIASDVKKLKKAIS